MLVDRLLLDCLDDPKVSDADKLEGGIELSARLYRSYGYDGSEVISQDEFLEVFKCYVKDVEMNWDQWLDTLELHSSFFVCDYGYLYLTV